MIDIIITIYIAAAPCMELVETKSQSKKMRVIRGRLVHCRVPEKIESLEDHLIGFDEKDHGTVGASIV